MKVKIAAGAKADVPGRVEVEGDRGEVFMASRAMDQAVDWGRKTGAILPGPNRR